MSDCNCPTIFKEEIKEDTHKLCGGIVNKATLDKLISVKPKRKKEVI